MSTRKVGDDGEQFVADLFRKNGFIVEVHPRTFRTLYLHGKKMQISKDNDYHNVFDVKAERSDCMVYAQVKVEEKKSNTSLAQKHIDVYFPYEFPYQKIQTWMLWKEWVAEPRRHKEFRYIIQERQGFTDKTWTYEGNPYKKGNWKTMNNIS